MSSDARSTSETTSAGQASIHITDRRIRLAVLVDEETLPYWIQRVVRQILDDPRFYICLAMRETGPRRTGGLSLKGLAFRSVQLTELPFVAAKLPTRCEGAPLTFDELAAATGGRSLSVSVVTDDNGPRLAETDVARIRRANLDVIVYFGSRPLSGAVALAATHGVITLRGAEGESGFKGAVGFREVSRDIGSTRVSLCRLSAEPEVCHDICIGHYKTQTSWTKTVFAIADQSANLILDHLGTLYRGDDVAMTRSPAITTPALSAFDVTRYIGKVGRNFIVARAKLLAKHFGMSVDRWSIFVGRSPLTFESLRNATETRAPKGEFWADPFLYSHEDGTMYVFFENYEYRTGRGKISVGQIDGMRVRYLGDAITTGYHLSFPYIFSHAGQTYMIPETGERERIEIWRCDSFPFMWSLHKVALEGVACADTTLVNYGDAWWVFTNIARGTLGDHCNELHVFQATSPLLDNLTAHQKNPVVVDARTARNGGRPFVVDGRLYRFAQDNAHRYYGRGLSLMLINDLSLTAYNEAVECSYPHRFVRGVSRIHHADIAGDLFVCDGFRTAG